MDSRRILSTLYGPRARTSWLHRLWTRSASARWHRIRQSRRNAVLVAASLFVSTTLLAHIYYYNRLVDLSCEVETTWAQVEALQERRANVQEGLTEIARVYLRYEQDVFTRVTALRTGAPGAEAAAAPAGAASPASPASAANDTRPALPAPSPPGAPGSPTPAELLARVHFVAEQYPELHLSQNLQQFSASLVASESEVSKAIMRHNDAVAHYTTLLAQFPANIFARIAGFEYIDFYDPGDPETLRHRRLAF